MISALAEMAISSPFCISGRCHSTPGVQFEKINEKIITELDLNEKQQKVLTGIKHGFMQNRFTMSAARTSMKDELILQLKSDNFETAVLREIFDDYKEEMDDMIT